MSEPIFALDLETKSLDKYNTQFALEPYRLVQKKAKITDVSLSGPDTYGKHITDATVGNVRSILEFLKGKTCYAHNALFDIAWLYALFELEGKGSECIALMQKIEWRDTMLLTKHLLNSQAEQFKTKEARDEEGGYDLLSLVKRFVKDDTPGKAEFLHIKSEEHVAGEDKEYWSNRAIQDTHFTRLLAIELQAMLPESQRNVFLISQKSLIYVARAWVQGCYFDWDRVQKIQPQIVHHKNRLASQLGLPVSTLQSPSQLSTLLFDTWGLTPISRGKTGKGSTKKDELKMIALQAEGTPLQNRMRLIMSFKKLQTLQTKYMNGFERVKSYVGENKTHGAPRIFGTYTGRYTYASKTKRKQVWQNSIAMHQLPKEGPAKACVLPPEGKKVGKYDASGQEIAFMAWASGDLNMTNVLCQGMNVHSWMATNLTGEDYATFIERLHSGDEDAYITRLASKLLNLSCQYRIGWKAIQAKFFGTYDKIITQRQSNNYLNIYKVSYPGVPIYWKETCAEARNKGYAETIAGRRYYLTDWSKHRWATESSAINMPVQGSGADQKDLIVWLVSEQFPEITFSLDVHDEAIFFLPEDNAEELHKEVVHFLNCIDYNKWWNMNVPMPLHFEGILGDNFKEGEEYAQSFTDIQNMRADRNVNCFITRSLL
jgi:DNA polymerase-1